MELHNLKPAKGSIKRRKRVGRGSGSGKRKTAGRGHNGAQSRSGYKTKLGFEGGQMPLQRRLPAYGRNPTRTAPYRVISLGVLQGLVEKMSVDVLNQSDLISHGLLKKKKKYKILGVGKLLQKLSVEAHAFSASAKKAIEAQGGTATVIK